MIGMDEGSIRGEGSLAELLDATATSPADRLPVLAARAAERLGARDLQLYLVDHAQMLLIPIDGGDLLAVEGTLAGLAFRRIELQVHDTDDGAVRLWVPLLDGTDRLGVMALTLPAAGAAERQRVRRLATLLADLIMAKNQTGDTFHRIARRKPMSLAAEMQWSLMPPLTAATDRAVVSAMVEPAYEVGGDIVDYAISTDMAHLAVFDPMGHDLAASVMASVAVGAYRNARRFGASLPETAAALEHAVADQFHRERFATAILATVDLASGRVEWINAGHPPGLLIRDGRLIKEITAPAQPPLGMALAEAWTASEEQLEPGDRMLLYTDGVTEARDAEGNQFGVDRLVDFIARAEADGDRAPETMRRLSHAVLAHQGGELQDDATHLMLEWLASPGL